ncbi:MAG: hypothetical protein RLZZ103_1285, partial [Pseudomonadota bacterium]
MISSACVRAKNALAPACMVSAEPMALADNMSFNADVNWGGSDAT